MSVRQIPVTMEVRASMVLDGRSAHAHPVSPGQCVKSTSTNVIRLHAVMVPRVKTKLTALNASVLRESLESAVRVGIFASLWFHSRYGHKGLQRGQITKLPTLSVLNTFKTVR